jgi:hypothetical protein
MRLSEGLIAALFDEFYLFRNAGAYQQGFLTEDRDHQVWL